VDIKKLKARLDANFIPSFSQDVPTDVRTRGYAEIPGSH
jgi:hypothetical protein